MIYENILKRSNIMSVQDFINMKEWFCPGEKKISKVGLGLESAPFCVLLF